LSTLKERQAEGPEPTERTPEMNHPKQDTLRRDRHLQNAIDHAHRLSEPRLQAQYTPAWWAEATHVGDLTALAALALARSPRA
jgi:hypothetical protein